MLVYLFYCPRAMIDLRIQVVVPAFPTLIAVATPNFFRHLGPFSTVHQYSTTEFVVLFRCPRTLLEMVCDLVVPPLPAIFIASSRDVASNLMPTDVLARLRNCTVMYVSGQARWIHIILQYDT